MVSVAAALNNMIFTVKIIEELTLASSCSPVNTAQAQQPND